MYLVYVLESETNGRYYIGYTQDIRVRLYQHNQGKVRSTRLIRPWKVAYTEEYSSIAKARLRERALKALKSRHAIQKLIRERGPVAQSVRAQS